MNSYIKTSKLLLIFTHFNFIRELLCLSHSRIINNIDPIDSHKTIQTSELTNNDQMIVDVQPLVLANDEVVHVYFESVSPNVLDFIAAYSPADANISSTVPVMFGSCDSDPNYLSTGKGLLNFQFTNLRDDISFYFFTGGYNNTFSYFLESPSVGNNQAKAVMKYPLTVSFENINEPLKNRIIPTSDPRSFKLLWSSATSKKPLMKYGHNPGEYTGKSYASTSRISQDSLCGSPASTYGWRDLGLIHTAYFTSLLPTYYVFGDEDSDSWSKEFYFTPPPLPGKSPELRPLRVALLADMGIGSAHENTGSGQTVNYIYIYIYIYII